jgi:PEP-CTERM motif-containing protein
MNAMRLTAMAAVLVGTTAAAVAGPAGAEQGPNLVTNGSFESNLTGWTASGFASLGFDYGIDTASAHTGSKSFQGGAIDSLGLLTQTLATVPGTSYNVDLWLASDGFFENELQVLWNGAIVFDRKDLFPQGFTQIVIDPLATGTTTTLAFGFRDDSGFLHIDDVSVRAVSAVPEPSSVALLGLGLVTIARRLAKRQQSRGATGSPA